MDILQIENLKKKFGTKEVLKDLNLVVPEHSVFGFVGQNGAGKTTTMKSILGLLAVDYGSIYVCGEKVHYGQTNTNRNIGYLPDVPEFYGYMTPLEYLTFCGEISAMPSADIKKRAKELLELTGLATEKKRIHGFSRGMKQRLGIAQALLNEPRLLICDEPTSALDPAGRKEILDILSSVREKTTVLFSTHILSDVERICDNVAFLHNGEIILQGTIDEVKNHYAKVGYELEIERSQDMAIIEKAFPDIKKLSSLHLQIGDSVSAEKLLRFMLDNKIAFVRFEKLEPSLESMFLEVIQK